MKEKLNCWKLYDPASEEDIYEERRGWLIRIIRRRWLRLGIILAERHIEVSGRSLKLRCEKVETEATVHTYHYCHALEAPRSFGDLQGVVSERL